MKVNLWHICVFPTIVWNHQFSKIWNILWCKWIIPVLISIELMCTCMNLYLNNFLLAVVKKRMMTIKNRNAGRLSTYTPKTTSVAITIIIHNPYFNSVPRTYFLEQNKIENDIPVVAYIIPILKNRVFRLCRLRHHALVKMTDFPQLQHTETVWNHLELP